MRRHLAAALVSTGLLVFGGAAAYAASGGLPSQSHGRSSAAQQYGERPGKGCGDTNHVHTGPPGNPSNTACPPQSQHQGTTAPQAQTRTTRHASRTAKACRSSHKARHHARKAHRHASRQHHRHGARAAAKRCKAAKTHAKRHAKHQSHRRHHHRS